MTILECFYKYTMQEGYTVNMTVKYIARKWTLEIIDIIKDMKRWALKWKITNIECGCQDCSNCVL